MAESVMEFVCEQAVRFTPQQGPGVARKVIRKLEAEKKFDARRDLDFRAVSRKLFGGEHAAENRLRRIAATRSEWVGEATEAVDLTAFRDILGTVTVDAVEEGAAEVNSPADELVETVDAGSDPNNERLVPYKAAATDPSRDVAPGTEYPKTGFASYKVRAPVPNKHGLVAQLTLETYKANDRKQFLDSLKEVGRVVELERVRRKLRLPLGITNNWTLVSAAGGATTANTYATTAGRANWVVDLNLANGPKEIDRLQQKFGAMTHPLTGEPIDVGGGRVFTVRNNLYTVTNAANVREIRTTTSGVEYVTGNPVSVDGPILSDVRAYTLLTTEAGVEGTALSAAEASTVVVMGNFKRAFKWREVEDLVTFEAGPGDMNESDAQSWPPAFYQDIVYAVKARWWGAGYVHDPYEVLFAYDQD